MNRRLYTILSMLSASLVGLTYAEGRAQTLAPVMPVDHASSMMQVSSDATINPADLSPAIPAEILLAAQTFLHPPPREAKELPPSSAEDDGEKKAPLHIVSHPGINDLAIVSVGHLNRIITPFETPKVMTTSQATVKIKANVVYVAPSDDQPVTLFITPNDDQTVAISLTLVPRKVAPREIRVTLPVDVPVANTQATVAPYDAAIAETFRSLALGQVPPGYGLRVMRPDDAIPFCAGSDALTFEFLAGTAQRLSGSLFEITVGVISNTGDSTLELRESLCQSPLLAAVAFWPLTVLEPGQKSEVYVANRRSDSPAPVARRPLLAGAPS